MYRVLWSIFLFLLAQPTNAQRGGGGFARGGSAIRGGSIARGAPIRGMARGATEGMARGGSPRSSDPADFFGKLGGKVTTRGSYSALRSAFQRAALDPVLGRPTFRINTEGEVFSGTRNVARLDRSGLIWQEGKIIGQVRNGQLVNTTGVTIGYLQGFTRSSTSILSRDGNSVTVLQNTWFDIIRESSRGPEMFYVRLRQSPFYEGDMGKGAMIVVPLINQAEVEKPNPLSFTDEQRIETKEYRIDLKGCQKKTDGIECFLEITSKGLDRKIGVFQESQLTENWGNVWNMGKYKVNGHQELSEGVTRATIPADKPILASTFSRGDFSKQTTILSLTFHLHTMMELRHDTALGPVWRGSSDDGIEGVFENFPIRDELGQPIRFSPRTVENPHSTTIIDGVKISFQDCQRTRRNIGLTPSLYPRDCIHCVVTLTNISPEPKIVTLHRAKIHDLNAKAFHSEEVDLMGHITDSNIKIRGKLYPGIPTDAGWWFAGSWPNLTWLPFFLSEINDIPFEFAHVPIRP